MHTRSQSQAARSCCPLLDLDDDLLIELLAHTPFFSHDPLKLVCRSFERLVNSRAFHLVHKPECALLAFAGHDSYDGGYNGCSKVMRAFVRGHWLERSSLPAWSMDGDLYHVRLDDSTLILVGGQQHPPGYDVRAYHGFLFHYYNLEDDSWYKLDIAPLRPEHDLKRSNAACALVNGMIVFAGGQFEDWERDDEPSYMTDSVVGLHSLSSVKGCPSVRPQWDQDLPPMPHAVQGALAFALNGNLYVAGGHTKMYQWGAQHSRHLQKLDLGARAWTTCAALPPLLFQCGAVHSGRFFLISRAEDDAPTIYAYDAESDTWQLQPRLRGELPVLLYAKHGFDSTGNTAVRTSHADCGSSTFSSDPITVAPYPEGLFVLCRKSGNAAIITIVAGLVCAARTLSVYDYWHGTGLFHTDLLASSLVATSRHKELVKDWACAVVEASFEAEHTNGDAEEASDEGTTGDIAGARVWLESVGLPIPAGSGEWI
jgi:hypothetical protein